eukprot:5716483-Prymnesium_polylepis.1
MNGTPRTKAQLGLDQIKSQTNGWALRVTYESPTVRRHGYSKRGNVVTVGDFGLKWPYEP